MRRPTRKATRRARLRSVPPPAPARASALRRAVSLAASFSLVVGLVVGLVTLQALVAQTSFRMESLQDRAVRLQQQNARLWVRAAELSAPARITREASRLGLRLPEEGEVQPLRVEGLGPSGGEG